MDDRIEHRQLELVYRGPRNYIQGADIYSAIVDNVSQVLPEALKGVIKIIMHEFAHNQCALIFSLDSTPVPRPEAGRAEFFLGDRVHGWVVETSAPVVRRMPYDEGEIVSRCEVVGRIIRLTETPPNSPIETLIAATKFLHQTLFPSTTHKWIISRLELRHLLREQDSGNFVIELMHNLNNQLTRSAVRICGEPVGHIYFSAIKP